MMIVSHEKNLDEQNSSKKHIKRDFLEKSLLIVLKFGMNYYILVTKLDF